MNSFPITTQILSLLGALLCLFAYIGHQLKWVDANKFAYNFINAAGSAILAYLAFKPFQVGFFVMEFIWMIISLYALFNTFRTSLPPQEGEKRS